MDNQIKLEEITDINQLKAYKSDNYDLIEQAKRQIEISSQNIANLNARIEQLKSTETAIEEKQ